jgi:tetrahydromethanopterin S-methyltransferase subunit D
MGKVPSVPQSNPPPAMSNGGIMGSGIFGMFGSTVVCNAQDTSTFCMLSKAVNVIIMIGFILLIIYFIYIVFKYFTGNKTTAPPSMSMVGGYRLNKSRSRRGRR